MKRMLSMLLTLALLCFLCACAQTLPEEVAQTWSGDAAQFDDEEGTLVVGADYSGFGVQGVCVRDEGIFYISGSVASYYDFESEEAYCLCSDPQMETTSSSDDEYRRACQHLLNTDTMELTELYSGQYPACGDVICISGGRAIQSISSCRSEPFPGLRTAPPVTGICPVTGGQLFWRNLRVSPPG